MRSIAYGLGAVGVASLLAAHPASAQEVCGPRAELIKRLADKYQEAPIAVGIVPGGGVVEVLSSTDGTSWTILASFPSGVTCLVLAGENLQMLPQLAKVGHDS